VHADGHRELPATFLPRPGNIWTESFVRAGRELCAREMVSSTPILNASGVVFRRDLAEAAGYADPSWKLAGDWKFWVDLLLRSDLAFVAKPLNYFRCHPKSVRSSAERSGYAVLETYRIANYLRSRVAIRRSDLQTARWLAALAWAQAFRSGGPRPSFHLQYRVLVQALKLDPLIPLRLVKALRQMGAR